MEIIFLHTNLVTPFCAPGVMNRGWLVAGDWSLHGLSKYCQLGMLSLWVSLLFPFPGRTFPSLLLLIFLLISPGTLFFWLPLSLTVVQYYHFPALSTHTHSISWASEHRMVKLPLLCSAPRQDMWPWIRALCWFCGISSYTLSVMTSIKAFGRISVCRVRPVSKPKDNTRYQRWAEALEITKRTKAPIYWNIPCGVHPSSLMVLLRSGLTRHFWGDSTYPWSFWYGCVVWNVHLLNQSPLVYHKYSFPPIQNIQPPGINTHC